MDGDYRYRLTRVWDKSLPRLMWVMLNPSTADDHNDDPTIRRITNFSKRLGFGSMAVGNLFAIRSRWRSVIRSHPDPIGKENDWHIELMIKTCKRVICAWGNDGAIQDRSRKFDQQFGHHRLYCLGTTKSGEPRHPLYLPKSTTLLKWGNGSAHKSG